MIKIDGSYLEGGGQIVRTALALSILTQKPFEVDNIRKGRKEPGLKTQHLYGIKALKQLSDSVAVGDEIGSTSLRFYPRKLVSKNIEIDVGTAGSITLLMQSVLFPILFASKGIKIKITGGTDVSWSPSFDYFNNVFLPQVQKFAKVETRLIKRGYFPKGNGTVEILISPKFKINEFASFEDFINELRRNILPYNLLSQHHLVQIKGISHASKDLQQAKVSERQAKSAQDLLRKKLNTPISISAEYQETLSTGSGITLWAIFSKNINDIDELSPIRIGSDVLGERGIKSEDIGEQCAYSLIKEIESKASVDHFLCDQILAPLAFTRGSIIASSISNHSKSNIYAIEQFMGKIFKLDENNNNISV